MTASNSMLDLITTIAMRDSEIGELKKRIIDLENRREVEIKDAIKSSLSIFGDASLSIDAINVLANKYAKNLKLKGGE